MEEQKNKKPLGSRQWLWILVPVAIFLILNFVVLGGSREPTPRISLDAFAQRVQAGQASRIIVRGDDLILETADGGKAKTRKEEDISAIETLRLFGVSQEALAKIEIEVERSGSGIGNILGVILAFAPLLLIGAVGFYLLRSVSKGPNQMLGNIGRSKARLTGVNGQRPAVTFADVAGANETKRELQEVVEFLRDPSKFAQLGARIPKGVLLVGPPGTGKTLLARAVAGEAGVPFFSISGSEFVEMFVGVGAARVRDLFQQAKANAPGIIFIDEIDAVGRRRGVGLGGGNDEREQTLNQILVEMDGFENETGVIVLAATNRADVLDPALLRPGRFDRRVMVDRPDAEAREAILKVHARGKVLAPELNLTAMAKLTVGFTGADLANLMNEAAILAVRRGLPEIGNAELMGAFERLIAGPERNKNILSPQECETVAYHEAGHTLVMLAMPNGGPIHKVSIVSRGPALGYTMPLPERDEVLKSREAFEDQIAGLMGGRAAEKLMMGRVTTGAANDLTRATALARAMVTQYAMSDALGLRTFDSAESDPIIGWPSPQPTYAESTARKIDAEITRILDQAYQRAKAVLTEHSAKLQALATALLEHETLERPAIEKILATSDTPATKVA